MAVNLGAQSAAADIPIYAKCLLAVGGSRVSALSYAQAARVPDRVLRMLGKSAIGASDSADFGLDMEAATRAYFANLRTRSVFFRMLDQGFRKVPLRTRLGILAANATAYVQAEGKAIPVSKLSLNLPTLEPQMAAAILVVTDDVARSLDGAASAMIGGELRGAIADVVDAGFWDTVIDSGTPSTSSAGTTDADRKADLKALLDDVATDAAAKLFWAMAPDVANRASLVDDARAAMTPLGGEMLGLPALVSNSVPAGTLRLVDANQIAANAEGIELDASNEAAVQMDTAPTGDSAAPTASELVSLFQANATALLARVRFGAERTRTNAVAEVTGIAWA